MTGRDSLAAVTKRINADEFEATCVSLLDEVEDHRIEYVITRQGRPVAKLVPIDQPVSLVGSVRALVDDEHLLFNTCEEWTAGR